ncbi:MAG: lysophospholipid acyltransferase family protein [Pseudomonadota bacterium]
MSQLAEPAPEPVVPAPLSAVVPAEDDFTYADPNDGRLRRLAIRSIERMTGQRRLRRLYAAHLAERDPHFWASAIRRLGVVLDYDVAKLWAELPETGPVVVVANHPYGVLDGLMIGHLMATLRPDFRIVANGILTRSAEAAPYLFPIEFAETPAAREINLRSRRDSIAWLRAGGVLVVFPGGTVSTAPRPFGPAVDPRWRPFTARLIHAAEAPVLPVCFVGQNSRLFQLASHVSMTLRLSLLFHEVANKIGTRQRIEIGDRIPYAELATLRDRQALVDELRRRTYALHPIRHLGQRVLTLRTG